MLQINSLIDVGSSFYSQHRKLTYKFEDNSGFEACSNDGKADSDTLENHVRVFLLLL